MLPKLPATRNVCGSTTAPELRERSPPEKRISPVLPLGTELRSFAVTPDASTVRRTTSLLFSSFRAYRVIGEAPNWIRLASGRPLLLVYRSIVLGRGTPSS